MDTEIFKYHGFRSQPLKGCASWL